MWTNIIDEVDKNKFSKKDNQKNLYYNYEGIEWKKKKKS